MRFSHQLWLAATFLTALAPTGIWAQDPVLIREVISREYSIHVGGVETTPQKEIVSRKVSISVENGSSDLVHEIISREYDVLVDNPGTPPAVNDVTVTVSPTGESVMLDWAASNPWAVRDIQRFDIYLSDSAPITDITGLTAYASVGGDSTRLTLDGLTAFTDHYFAIVAVDGLGNRLTTVPYHAAYVLSPEVVSREVSLFVGQEPEPPYKEVVSREYDLVIDKPGPPPAIESVVVSLSPLGDVASLDWSSYNQWAVGDVQRFDIYLSDDGPFTDVSEMTPFASIGGGSTSIQLSGLAQNTDHYFAVVAVDALGNRIPQVSYSAGYVLMPEVVSREVSLFIGQEPEPPYCEIVSREMSIVVADGTTPAPVTGIDSGFSAVTSVGLFGAIDLDWTSYNELLQKDVSRYRVYLSETYFEDVTGMELHSFVQTGKQTATIDGFPSAAIRYVAVVAEDAEGNFNPVVRAHSVQASYLPYFRFFDETVIAYEGEVVNLSVVLEGLTRTGRYQLAADSARAFDGTTGDYVDAPVPLEFKFNPTLNTSEAIIQIPIIRDQVDEPDEEFAVLIVNPNEGSATVVASVRVIIKDQPSRWGTGVWHPEIQTLPTATQAASHQLGVELSPGVPGAQWRLVGEPFWRNPGSMNLASHLAEGMHRVEYKPVAGYGLPVYPEGDPLDPYYPANGGPDPTTWDFFGPSVTHVLSTTYPLISGDPSGTLRVNLRPNEIASFADEPARAQWRMLGETVWRNSGTSVTLPVGKHWIEFKDGVAGHHAPVPRSAAIEQGIQTYLQMDYHEAEDSAHDVAALAFQGDPDSGHVNEAPQSFVGQIESSIGHGTGVAVTAHTVLTAASVVFDQDRLAGAGDIVWLHQRHADFGEDLQDHRVAPVQYPRGYKLLTGYASMRREEASAGNRPPTGHARSAQQDVAVLYFLPDLSGYQTARSGFSGFLADFSITPRPNPWLSGSLEKRLCGYPMTGIALENRGLMHAVGPLATGCESFGGQLYRSQDVAGRPGMEGAPLFIKHPNGNSYPAAIYLGQNGGAIFRAFDRYVAAAIYLAEWEAVGYVRMRLGSGGLYQAQWRDDEGSGGFLYVEFAPSRGSWRLLHPDTFEVISDWLDSGLRLPVTTGAYAVEFRSLAGFATPPLQMVATSAGLTTAALPVSYEQTYESWAESWFSPETLLDATISGPEARLNDLPNLIAFGFGLEPGASVRPAARPEESLPGLPRVTIDPSSDPPTITVDFLRRNSALAPELNYIIEFADSPAGPWSDAATLPDTRILSDEWDHVHLTSAPIAEAGRKFVRVRVERSP